MVLRVGAPEAAEQQQTFNGSGEVSFTVALTKGTNPVLMYSTDTANVASMPNGDTRRLIVGLRDVFLESSEKTSGALVRGNGVSIESGSVRGAWAIDDAGPPENDFLWLGSGENEGVVFTMTSPKAGVVVMKMIVSPGPSRREGRSRLALRVDGKASGEKEIASKETLEFRVEAGAGRHEVKFYAKDSATVLKLPNGDPRKLIAGLHEISVEAKK